MADLTRDDVLKLARLARLELSESEQVEFSKELTEVLGYVEQLGTVDTAGLKPTSQVTGLKNVMRDDQLVDYGVDGKELLRGAPQSQDGHIKVKRMIA